jgi:hypothetical protein
VSFEIDSVENRVGTIICTPDAVYRMAVLALPGFSDGTLGAGLAIVWSVVLATVTVRYRSGATSRERCYLTLSMGSFWLVYSLLHLSTATGGTIEIAVVVLSLGLFTAGAGVGVRWWRIRSVETDPQATT